MEALLSLKTVSDDFEVSYEIFPPVGTPAETDERRRAIVDGLRHVDERLYINQNKLDELNAGIERLTNHADGFDYMVAVGSGILAGLIDSFYVGEFSLERGTAWGSEKANNFVESLAKLLGYKAKDGADAPTRLAGAIRHLEKYGVPSDSIASNFGGGLQHHLRDFAHHPTPVGLVFSLLTQFTGKAYGTNTLGVFVCVDVKNKMLIGKDISQKLFFGVIFWALHMVSDIAGTSSTPGAGTGLPGPLLSLLKELSTLPLFKDKDGINDFSVWISKLFNGTLLAQRDESGKIVQAMRFDLRAEIGVAHELGRQAIPVIINECIVRGFYFIRHLGVEIKEKKVSCISDLNKIEFEKIKPWKNRTIVRMLTIATGTFTAVDMADAAIRSGLKSGGNLAAFAGGFLLRVNFIGIGRFGVAVATDASMGIKRSNLRNERLAIYNEQLHLIETKVFYLQSDMWISAESTEQTIQEAEALIKKTAAFYIASTQAIYDDLNNIQQYIPSVEKKNPGLLKEINDIIEWN